MSDRREALDAAIAKINKAFGEGSVFRLGDAEIPKVDVVSTGALTLDQALGIGGLPRGRFLELYGPEAAGKTTMALHVVANVQKQGGTVLYMDVEHSLSLAYAAVLGVNVAELLHSQPDTGEQALEIIEELVRTGEIDCVILDSVAMLVPKKEIEGEMQDKQFAEQARLITKGVRKLLAPVQQANCLFVIINQMRTGIGPNGSFETTPGGRGLRHAYSVRIGLRKKDTIRNGMVDTGTRVIATVAKNKLAPALRTAEFDLVFGRGIDYVASVFDVARDLGLFIQSGSWIKYNGEVFSQGRDKAVEKMRTNPQLLESIEREVKGE